MKPLFWLSPALLVLGCGGTETGNPTRGLHCAADRDCTAMAQNAADAVRAPIDPPTFVSATCTASPEHDGGPAPSGDCTCSGSMPIVVTASASAACAIYARARDCLYESTRFSGCDPATSGSCDATCSEIEALLDADAARTLDVSVRAALCTDDACAGILSIEGRCFVGDSRIAHDCSLDPREILSREAQGQP